jgi:hypothetical protein
MGFIKQQLTSSIIRCNYYPSEKLSHLKENSPERGAVAASLLSN